MFYDVSFLIFHYPDSPDRERNLAAVRSWLGHFGARRVGIIEPHDCGAMTDGGFLIRTRARNILAKQAATSIICQLDGDVICEPPQFIAAVEMIRSGWADFVYPYILFRRMHEGPTDEFCRTGDFEALKSSPDYTDTPTNIFGGAVFANRQKYLEIGGENENYLGWPGEDKDRWERMTRLGRTERVDGILYHLEHARTVHTEGKTHPHRDAGIAELTKVRAMSNEELLAYAQRGFK